MSLITLDRDIRKLTEAIEDATRKGVPAMQTLARRVTQLEDTASRLEIQVCEHKRATIDLAKATDRLAAAVEKLTQDPPEDRRAVSFHLIGQPRPKEG